MIYLNSGIHIDRKRLAIFMLLIFMLVFAGFSELNEDGHKVSIATESLNIVRDEIGETYGWTVKDSFCQRLAFRSASPDNLAVPLPVIPETIGVLVIAHGSDEAQWNEDVINAVKKVNLPYPVVLGFLEYHEQDIPSAVSVLENKGVNRIIAVPLFVCTYSNHIEEIRYVLGLRDTLPETDPSSAPRARESTEEAALIPIQSRAKIVLASAIDDHPAAAAILAEHLGEISKSPENEIAVLAGHGWDAPEYKEKWDEMFTSLASQVKTAMGLKDARHAFVAMGDPPLADMVSAAMTEGDVLIVPVMLSEGYFTKTLIPRLLTGLTYRYTEKSLLPNLSAAAIIEDRVSQTISSEKWASSSRSSY